MALQISSIFDNGYYLAQNQDVAAAVARGDFFGGALEHFLRFGQFENRDPSSFFNSNFYFQRNTDVQQAVTAQVFRSAFEHFVAAGQFEGRDPSTLFNSNFYLQRHTDVQQAVSGGTIRSAIVHFIQYGQFEQRQPSREFNPTFYLQQNSDVQAAVTSGTFASAFQHFVQHGRFEGRSGGGGVPGGFLLQLLHASDFEAGIPALDDAPRMSSVVNGLRSQFPENTLFLSSGDNYIPGPFFAASSDPTLRPVLGREDIGRADIIILNSMGVQASVLGNHEFDQGTRQVRTLIARDREYSGTAFPYLSANLDFAPDANLRDLVVPDGQEASTIPNSIAKSTVITVNGERIGIVGATTPTLPSISSPGDVVVLPANSQDLDALAATIQPSVDALTGQGINKIVLLAHLQQLDFELNLAPKLRDVDIIVAGGSHTLLSDSSDRLRVGDTSGGTYPILRTSATGEPVVVVNTTSNYKYVGRLVTEFDSQGRVVTESLNPETNGAYATDELGVIATGNITPNPTIVAVTQALKTVINTKDAETFGRTNVYLNGERNSVRTEETNLGNLTADANLAAARNVDPSVVISIKNGGGIREAIGAVVGAGGNDPNAGQKIPPVANPTAGKEAGQISLLDIENSLRFNNQLTLLTLTAEQLQQVIEHGVADTAPGRTPGRFPQVGGMAFSFDPNRTAGSRVLSLAVKDANGNTTDVVVQNGQLVGDPNRTFRIVTLNFLAGGGDSYPFPNFPTRNPVETGIGEQTALANYLTQRFANTAFNVPDVGVESDTRIQNLTARNDTVISGTTTAQSLPNLDLFNDCGCLVANSLSPNSMRVLVENFADPMSGVLSQQMRVSDSVNPLDIVVNTSNPMEMNFFSQF